ncbi:MAG: YceI family protein, partial [Proteobacteria bacterium]
KKYPEARFVSSSIQSAGKDQYTVEGDLTLHGVTKKTKFNLVSLGQVKDPYGIEKRMYQATTELVRKDFNLTYNAKLESGGVVLGETVKLTIDVEAAPKTVAAK